MDDPLQSAAGGHGARMLVARFGATIVALVAGCLLVWFTAGIPPAFAGNTLRGLALGLLCLGIACLVGARWRRDSPTPQGGGGIGRRWPLQPPAGLSFASVVLGFALIVPLTFVVDSAVPALVLGADPGQATATRVALREASSRRDVDRTRVAFPTETGMVETWASDPHYTLRDGSAIVYDRDNPRRAMSAVTWAKARSNPWLLPTSLLLWFSCLLLPVTVGAAQLLRFGTLRPGVAIARVTRPRRAKLLEVTWVDGASALFVDMDGLADALRRKIAADGLAGTAIPGPGDPPRSA